MFIQPIKIKSLFTLIVLLLGTLNLSAQREKNYIYLFDCTWSMKKNGLWDPAQSALNSNIALRASIPGSHFTVIPFGDNPYDVFSFDNGNYATNKQAIGNAFDKYINQAKFTNISDVLKSGFQKVDSKKDNEIYLFTDGMPNNTDSPSRVAQTIRNWCASHRNSKLYYVALTKGVINPVIKQAIDECSDASIVQCENGVIPIITTVSNDIYTNLEELGSGIETSFSIPGSHSISASTTDSNFDASVAGNKTSNGKFTLRICSRENLTTDQLHQLLQGEEYEFPVTVNCLDKRFTIVNPIINVHVSDEVPSKLTLAGGVDEIQTDGVKWYDSFLWSDAAPDKKVVWDLAPVFKNELHNSRLELRFSIPERETNDFQVWYNGHAISNGQTISICPNQPALLEVQFNHDAQTGKRYFSLIPSRIDNLNFINDQPTEEYQGTSLRTDYNVGWNPLKTFLLWLGIILLVALILWFAILRRIFFPPIKLSKITITGPGSYYSSKKIRGARKAILTSKRKSQNIFSRIFTGEIKYIIAEHLSPELSIVPAGGKRKVKLRYESRQINPWEIYPSSIFGQYEKGTMTNKVTNDKSDIEFS
ncbi:MAG: VWA domain-containing protein [Bacteroidales bacterium]|nr:VWA domain-containing protein [Bacteroidales bacterium]